uniref:Uncharacterized protein n=1 Tax=Anguilla anguilla TaxID=7936 RepID=A0A0E9W2C9_ANGAN
MYFVGQSLI